MCNGPLPWIVMEYLQSSPGGTRPFCILGYLQSNWTGPHLQWNGCACNGMHAKYFGEDGG